MKNNKIIFRTFSLIIAVFFTATAYSQITQANAKYRVVDLYTGETISIYYDTATWHTINKTSNKPVDYYIVVHENSMPDTVHGITGIIVNNLIWKNPQGKWVFNEDKVKWDGNELKMKDKYGRKVKWENGEMKIKDWNNKFKSEPGDDTKYKEEWDKIKWKDNEIKVEKGTQKTKTREG